MYRMRAGLLRIALLVLVSELAGVPALAASTVPGHMGADAVMPCCRHAGPDHVCPMMHRAAGRAPADRSRCAMSACCQTAPAAAPALGLVLLAPPVRSFAVAPDGRRRAARAPVRSRPADHVPSVFPPPPWA